ncbi:MAG: DNA polymerase III subunit gamma/tau [Armatimonadaceae bacterium]
MAYQSLYRKYRPQTFSDVVGQQHVVRTLQNALQTGRVAHGYLFTGTRGTAKTTVARLLAKALNCESADTYVTEPCDQCEACRRITAGNCIDVVELDAASHRGVADIEEVRKAVGYGPMQHRYKVYIIDEAHQLSSDAKDAFLKTLEEPPANVVFILATTEPQSIPITIRSRCQQFDFRRGTIADISGRLRYVLGSEARQMSDGAILAVARAAEGSYRDSLSLLEQVLGFTDGVIEASDVESVLGLLEADHLYALTQAMATGDMSGAIQLADEILDEGKDARSILRSVANHLRDLLVYQLSGAAVFSDRTEDERNKLAQFTKGIGKQVLLNALDTIHKAQADLRWNQQHRLVIELAFARACSPVEQPTPQVPAVAASQPRQIEKPSPRPPATQDHAVPSFRAAIPADQNRVVTTAPPAIATEAPLIAQQTAPEPGNAPVVPAALAAIRAARAAGRTAPVPTTPDVQQPAAQIEAHAPVHHEESPMPPSKVVVGPEAEATSSWSLNDVLGVWPSFLSAAEAISKRAGVMLASARPIGASDGVVEIAFHSSAHKDMMSDQKQSDFVRKVLGRSLGLSEPIRGVRFTLEVPAVVPPDTGAGNKSADDTTNDSSGNVRNANDDEAVANAGAPDDPLLREVLEVFGGKMLEHPIH